MANGILFNAIWIMLLLLSYTNCEKKRKKQVCKYVPNVVCALITTNTKLTACAHFHFMMWSRFPISPSPLSLYFFSFHSFVLGSFSFARCAKIVYVQKNLFNCWTALDWLKASRNWITARGLKKNIQNVTPAQSAISICVQSSTIHLYKIKCMWTFYI